VRIEVLGSLRASGDDGASIELSHPKVACALIVLAVHAGRPVTIETLLRAAYGSDDLCGLEDVWLGHHLTQLRSTLGTTPDGELYLPEEPQATRYSLAVDGRDVDAVEFTTGVDWLLEEGNDLPSHERLVRERQLLDLWRADPVTEHRRVCKTADRLFKRHRRLYRELSKLAVLDLAAAGEIDEAEEVLEAVLEIDRGDDELLQLRERLGRGRLSPGAPRADPVATGTRGSTDQGGVSFQLLEAQADLAVFGLASAWQATASSPVADGLRAVLKELYDVLPPGELEQLVQMAAARASGSVTATALVRALWPDVDEPAGLRRLHTALRQVNARLRNLPSNQLHEFSLTLRTAEGPDEEAVVSINPVDVATLLTRSPGTASVMEPNLRLSWTLYDAGSYSRALRSFAQVAKAVSSGRVLTRTELTLFFYCFAKCLLKLNMYAPLQQLVEGPYRELARESAELEAERLQIAGTLHRHRGDLVESQRNLDEAVALLEAAVAHGGPPVLWRALCDAEVLQCHPRLDHAVAPGDLLSRQASVRFVKDALRRARSHIERFWQETGQTTHYEGRLGGTGAFATIADSIVDPGGVGDAVWRRAIEQARAGFEPEQARKPVGIVAGRAALAAVHLARATWLHRTQGDAGRDVVHRDLDTADEVLSVAMRHHLPTVELGLRFEHRKLLALGEAIRAARNEPGTDVAPDAMSPIV
jgi:tetratricopeptide (TPR) repeat protein